jgi:hypothetical protein
MASTTSLPKRVKKDRSHMSGPGGPWSKKAPRRLRKLYSNVGAERGWAVWRKHLAKRRQRPIAKLFPGRESALDWAVPADAADDARGLIEMLRRPKTAERETSGLGNAVLCWLSRADVAALDTGFALECLAWAWHLPALAEFLDERLWWQLHGRLQGIATAAPPASEPLAESLLHAELPLVLAYQFPELAESHSLVAATRQALDEAALEAADREPLVHGRRLDGLRPLVACWTRIRIVAEAMRSSPWEAGTLREYAYLVECALRLTRPGGAQTFTAADSPRWPRRLAKAIRSQLNHPKTRRLAQVVMEPKRAGEDFARTVRTSFELESAGIAVLRSNWRRQSPQIAVNYAAPQFQIELTLGKRALLAGGVELDVRWDGQPLVPRGPWEQICWESDDDIDYLELEVDLDGDVSVQRHILLARQDRFLFWADAVLGPRGGQIDYRAGLPLARDAALRAEKDTREGTIEVGKRACGRVLPLALCEWRSGAACGTLQAQGQTLELCEQARGQRLLAPLFFDLDPRRLRDEVTWRQLTVGEERQVVPRDAAVGYRVQVGRRQWLIYRSLAASAVRTVLGKNLLTELLVGRFGRGGEVKSLLEIEA